MGKKKTAFRKATQQIMTMKTNGTKACHWKHKYKTRWAKGTKRFWKFVNKIMYIDLSLTYYTGLYSKII